MSDVDIDLRLNESGNIIIHDGDNAVRNQVALIFNTIRGEIPMRPNVGSYLNHLLFEPITDTRLFEIETYLSEAVQAGGNLRLVNFEVENFNANEKVLTLRLGIVDTKTGDTFDFTNTEVYLSGQL